MKKYTLSIHVSTWFKLCSMCDNNMSKREGWEFGTHRAYSITTCHDWKTLLLGSSLQIRTLEPTYLHCTPVSHLVFDLHNRTPEPTNNRGLKNSCPSPPKHSNLLWMKNKERLGDRVEHNKQRNKRDQESYPKYLNAILFLFSR